MSTNIRHVNRVTTPPARNGRDGTHTYRTAATARAAFGRRRYDHGTRDDVTAASEPAVRAQDRLGALRARLAAMGVTADSPAVLDPEAEQIARAERRS